MSRRNARPDAGVFGLATEWGFCAFDIHGNQNQSACLIMNVSLDRYPGVRDPFADSSIWLTGRLDQLFVVTLYNSGKGRLDSRKSILFSADTIVARLTQRSVVRGSGFTSPPSFLDRRLDEPVVNLSHPIVKVDENLESEITLVRWIYRHRWVGLWALAIFMIRWFS